MENLCAVNLPNSFPTVYQQSGIPCSLQYDPNFIVSSYANQQNWAFPPSAVCQHNGWVEVWGSYPATGQFNYTPESYVVINNPGEYAPPNVSEQWQPSHTSDGNSFCSDAVRDERTWTGHQRSLPGNYIFIWKKENSPVYKTNLVRIKSLSDHDPDQIWLCKWYLLVPKIWSGPKRDLLMCKDHGPIEFGPVPNLDM